MAPSESAAIDFGSDEFFGSPLLRQQTDAGGVKVIEEFEGIICKRRYIIDAGTGRLQVETIGRHTQLILSQRVRDFIFPANYPQSVRPEYLSYMLWQLGTHVSGFCSSTLVMSSLLKAVGIGASPLGAGAATAAIKWVTKDGIGAVGSLLIGGRFGSLFDEDPKQWRMYADCIGSVGNILELATPLAPHSFLLLASLGNLTKAVARGLKQPSERVIQNHFASAANLGDIAAKEEVWEVAGQMAGLACGVVLLGTPGIAASYWTTVLVWFALRLLHLSLRYRCLHTLCFPTLNFKRAAILVRAHIKGEPLPGREACNFQERLLVPRQFTQPPIRLGYSLKQMMSGPEEAAPLLVLYGEEEYILTWQNEAAFVLPKVGCSSVHLLRAMWQAEWLHKNSREKGEGIGDRQLEAMDGSPKRASALKDSLWALKGAFPRFVEELEEAGWDPHLTVLRPPPNAPHLAL